MQDHNEAIYVRRAQRGDLDAQRAIVEAQQGRVFRVAYHLTGNYEVAQEATQETFLRAFARLQGFEPSTNLAAWLVTIARNLCLDWVKRRARRVVVSDPSPVSVAPPSDDPEADYLARERARRLEEALQMLPYGLREAFVLRQIEAMSYEDVAAALQISLGNAKVRVHRAREAMRDAMKKEDAANEI